MSLSKECIEAVQTFFKNDKRLKNVCFNGVVWAVEDDLHQYKMPNDKEALVIQAVIHGFNAGKGEAQ